MLAMQEELEELAAYVRQQPGAGPRSEPAQEAALVRVADRRLRKLEVF
jgi:hypothetical protein